MSIPLITQLETTFAYNPDAGTINAIPLTPPVAPNGASFQKGFPAITMPAIPTSGLPPFGQDFNGILNAISALNVWFSVGAGFVYNGALYNNSNPYITGYPIGARVMRADNKGYWLNQLDNNQTDPDNPLTGANWVQDSVYGLYNLIIPDALTTTITLTIPQAAFPEIFITEAVSLISPVTITLPSVLLKMYFIQNSTAVNMIFQTDAIGSNTITVAPGDMTIFAITTTTLIVDLSSTYITQAQVGSIYLTQAMAAATYAQRPNVGNNSYYATGAGGIVGFNTSNTLLPLGLTAGQPWISSNAFIAPWTGMFSGSAFVQYTINTTGNQVSMKLFLDGAIEIGADSKDVPGTAAGQSNLSFNMFLTAGQYIQVFAREAAPDTASAQVIFFSVIAVAN